MGYNSDGGSIQWSQQFPSGDGKYYEVISPKSQTAVIAIITSERWLGVWTHHANKRTRPCTGSELDCNFCYSRIGRRWKAYLCGVMFGTGKAVVLELTHGAVLGCPTLLDPNENLRGRKLRFWRKSEEPQSRMFAKLEGMPADYTVPPDFNLRRALCKIWGMPDDSDDDLGGMIVNPPRG